MAETRRMWTNRDWTNPNLGDERMRPLIDWLFDVRSALIDWLIDWLIDNWLIDVWCSVCKYFGTYAWRVRYKNALDQINLKEPLETNGWNTTNLNELRLNESEPIGDELHHEQMRPLIITPRPELASIPGRRPGAAKLILID